MRADVSEGTLVAPRHDDNELYEVIVNMDGKGGHINLSNDAYDIFEKQIIKSGVLKIEKYDYKILKSIK